MAKRSDKMFRSLAPRIMRDLMAKFRFAVDDAAAVLGNLGHESGGFKFLQEITPTVSGSRGGWGWAQWTGPRRRAFEAWAKERGLDLSSYEANYGFLVHELSGSEKKAVPATKRAVGLEAKVKAFEKAFERAGIKHYPSRVEWARIALDAYGAPAVSKPAAKPAQAPAQTAREMSDPAAIALVQGWLRNLGYTEVGPADGKTGPFTRTAIRAFRAENGLPLGDTIDQALIVALATAKPRIIAPERANASPADVREAVPEVKASWTAKVTANITAALATAGAFLSGIWDSLGEAKTYLEPIKDFVGDVPVWLWLVALAGGAFLLSRQFRKGEKAGVEALQTGARR